MRMTLDELINAMEPQARKDKALISKCVDGLTEYAAAVSYTHLTLPTN